MNGSIVRHVRPRSGPGTLRRIALPSCPSSWDLTKFARAGLPRKTLDNSGIRDRCQKCPQKQRGTPSARWCSRRRRAIAARCSSASACRSRWSPRISMRRRAWAKRLRRRRSGSPRRRLALSQRICRMRSSSARIKSPISMAQRSASPGTIRMPSRNCGHSPAARSSSIPASHCAMPTAAAVGAYWSTSSARFAGCPTPRSAPTCAVRRPTTAPVRSGPKNSASPCSSGSRATTRRR